MEQVYIRRRGFWDYYLLILCCIGMIVSLFGFFGKQEIFYFLIPLIDFAASLQFLFLSFAIIKHEGDNKRNKIIINVLGSIILFPLHFLSFSYLWEMSSFK